MLNKWIKTLHDNGLKIKVDQRLSGVPTTAGKVGTPGSPGSARMPHNTTVPCYALSPSLMRCTLVGRGPLVPVDKGNRSLKSNRD
jgi:hypothetical protein